ncbi:P27 family phage terminase small subunit [Azospirillum thiophilum]|uniref:P27 family phage terminase small subunit n=1 Tax=Azospirillum thiophilum TaxID=528244 RepID=UPI0009E2FC91|nr:P27 family phage terminase small subunit [Azospirillum thiophilum]
MTRGRKPKAEALNALAGNPGRRKRAAAPATEAPPAVASTEPVSEFAPPASLTKGEREVWLEELPRFLSTGLGRPSDLTTFRAYCEARALYLRCKKVIDRKGITYSTETGYVRTRPEVGVMNAQARLMAKYSDQLTQNTKARISTAAQLGAARQYQLPLPDAASPAAHSSDATKPQANHDDPVGWLQ